MPLALISGAGHSKIAAGYAANSKYTSHAVAILRQCQALRFDGEIGCEPDRPAHRKFLFLDCRLRQARASLPTLLAACKACDKVLQ